jgi:tetratricopeptide (TPR) repeat protein
MQDERELEQIEQYLEGTLPLAEATAFAEKLKNDPAFFQKVTEYQNILSGIDEFGQDEFFNQVQSWETSLATSDAEKKMRSVPFKQYLAWAAVVLLVLLPLGYWLMVRNTVSFPNDELFAFYFEPYNDITAARSSGADEILAQGMEYYNRGNYAEAISYLERYLTNEPNQPAVDFYLGVSYLATGQTGKAVQSFKKVITHGDSIFVEVAEWNLALSYLKAEDTINLKHQLQQIIKQPHHPYHSQAIELNERIK